jgi:glycosyltransferase involved in cell wall biosynthesis
VSKPRVTVAVLARDNADQIADCLQSAIWADELLVVLDDRSSDATGEIARGLGARVVERAFDSFAGQRDYALSVTRTEWVFFLDSDERVPPPLSDAIRARVKEATCAGWWVPRRN